MRWCDVCKILALADFISSVLAFGPSGPFIISYYLASPPAVPSYRNHGECRV